MLLFQLFCTCVADAGRTKIQEQQQHSLSDDLNAEPATHSGLNRTTTEDELKASSLVHASNFLNFYKISYAFTNLQ